jgi:ubiquinone/menaquinone biosynthesis C-methylase UbiE
MAGKMKNSVEKWLDEYGEEFLRRVGIKRRQTVLDFGCGAGNYTIPAAVIVGKEGRVYALDKERRGFWPSEGLDKLMRRAESRGLENIVVMKTSGEVKIRLEDESIDVVLLYDVLHYYYFPEEDRRKLLREGYRILKPNGFLSFYPGDPEVSRNSSELETIKREIEDTNFHLESGYTGMIIHENVIQKGHVLKFRKEKGNS